MFGLPDQAIGAVVAAFIAGVVALLGLIISKEQKVSEFRQQWIDALRVDVSVFITHLQCLYIHRTEEQAKWGGDTREDFISLTAAAARVRLRLNPKEMESAALLEFITKSMSAVKSISAAALKQASDDLVAATNVVLKQEWRRVRSGELTYRVTRWIVVLVTAALAIVLVRHFYFAH